MAFSFGDSSPNYEDYDYYNNYDYEDDDPFVDCKFCGEPVLSSRMEKHLDNKHKCSHCHDVNYMSSESLKEHIEAKHMVQCKYCDAKRFADEIAQHELTHSVIGLIQLGKLTDERFNQLVADNRIYAKDGCLYIKKSERMLNISGIALTNEI